MRTDPILKVNGISRRFGGLKAINGLDFFVKDKEIFSVIGPNGAGKTTLFNCLTGIFHPDQGTITFLGRDITRQPTHKIAQAGILRTFQNLQVFMNMTVLENVMTGCHMRATTSMMGAILSAPKVVKEERRIREWAKEALAFVGLEKEASLPANMLPYGHLKRLEIARALAAQPRLLLLDEPAAGLNDTETLEMRELIENIVKKGITVLLVEHNMGLVMECSNRILVLNYGECLTIGTPDDIQRDPKVIAAYLGQEA